jgi:molecular chaperone GrpE
MGRKEKENTESTENMDTQNGTETGEETSGVQSEVQAEESAEPDAEKKYAELNDKYLRLYSDFDNFRKRTIKEKADLISSASADVLKDLLVILDDFERATANNENVDDPKALRESFKLIQHKLILALTSKGLEAVESKGETFDADKHEAITNIPVTDENQKGKIVDVVERGYNLKGKTLRFAKVIVGQ